MTKRYPEPSRGALCPSEQDTIIDDLEVLLTAQGFEEGAGPLRYPNSNCWSITLTDDKFLVVVIERLKRKRPIIEITTYYPGRSKYPTIGKQAIAPQGVNVLLNSWKRIFAERLERVRELVAEKASVRCPHCESLMIVREAKQGPHRGKQFHGCIRFPDCRGFRGSMGVSVAADDGKPTDLPCPDCERRMAVRYVRQGERRGEKFFGCTGYPECQTTVTDEEAVAIRLMGKAPKSPNTGRLLADGDSLIFPV
jgi:ssDNA-binding Zn-finger/Zn-ribbon topoisomerase 1